MPQTTKSKITRSYYSSTIRSFLKEKDDEIFGKLSSNYQNHQLIDQQRNAWETQISILKDNLKNFEGHIYFEFLIPRMGKKVDNIIIIDDTIFVVEFKVGSTSYDASARTQVIDYALDLKHFHEGSHGAKLIPVLIATNASPVKNEPKKIADLLIPARCGKDELHSTLRDFLSSGSKIINANQWAQSAYKPTPTIVEAAQALFNNHDVEEISRSGAGANNLSVTADCLSNIIEECKVEVAGKTRKSICFVTGVPGAGKTLAGLNISIKRMNTDENEHAVFLSGNGPLVAVLREALARNKVDNGKSNGIKVTKKDAKRDTSAFIQNIHHFRDEYHSNKQPPTEKVVVFDEAQRAWDKDKASQFMQKRKNGKSFNMSEPEFLISVMNRHKDWCTIVCLIGGGQEINTGEAGLEGWLQPLRDRFDDWDVYYSESIVSAPNYLKSDTLKAWLKEKNTAKEELHLNTSLRAFKAKRLSEFVHQMLELNLTESRKIFKKFKDKFPIRVTRDLKKAKRWLRNQSRGSERFGIIASSGARRLKADHIDVKNNIDAPIWFLNSKDDVRSSFYLEDIATEFEIQGLEIDYACVAWGANFNKVGEQWSYRNFSGSKWQSIKKEDKKKYLKNAYRVLLTRARQGMILYIPKGSKNDPTRSISFYEETYQYILDIGIEEVK